MSNKGPRSKPGPHPGLDALADRQLAGLIAALRAEWERRGLSRWDVCRASGIREAHIKEMEAGVRPRPQWATLASYARALGLELRWELAEPGGAAPPEVVGP